jgi:hypothetical protein
MITSYRASTRAKSAPSDWRKKRCPHCGKPFLGRGGGWSSPFYCSERCAREARNERRRAARLRRRQPHVSTCAHCGDKFVHQRATGRYCSTRCRVAAHRA